MHSTLRRRLVAGLLVVVALPVAHAAAKQPEPPTVPSKIAPGAGHKVYLVGHATGVQIYRCNPTADRHAWGLLAPRADLVDDKGKVIVTHFGGPSWQARDGSTIVGARVDGVPAEGTIPWLLLSAKPAPGAPEGRLTGTTYIQRVNTTGGVAPAAATCTAATAGAIEEIPYTADYFFWKKSNA